MWPRLLLLRLLRRRDEHIRAVSDPYVCACCCWRSDRLAYLGIEVPTETAVALTAGLSGLAMAAWYTLARILEQKWPAAGVLLGVASSPDSYSKGTALSPRSSGEDVVVDVTPVDLLADIAPASPQSGVTQIELGKVEIPPAK